MGISNETKSKIFAQYLGQHWVRPDGVVRELNVKELQWAYEFHIHNIEKYRLMLLSLEDIKDSEILEIVKIFLGREDVSCRIERADKFYLAYYKEQPVENEKYKAIEMYLTINCKRHQIRNNWGYKYDNGTAVSTEPLHSDIQIYQYLQSKGYDLPNYLLNGKTGDDLRVGTRHREP